MYNSVINNTSDEQLLKQNIADLDGGHRGYGKADAMPKVNITFFFHFGTCWELESRSNSHKISLKSGQIFIFAPMLSANQRGYCIKNNNTF